MAWLMTAPSRVMRSPSHAGTRPPCSGRSALPGRRTIPFSRQDDCCHCRLAWSLSGISYKPVANCHREITACPIAALGGGPSLRTSPLRYTHVQFFLGIPHQDRAPKAALNLLSSLGTGKGHAPGTSAAALVAPQPKARARSRGTIRPPDRLTAHEPTQARAGLAAPPQS